MINLVSDLWWMKMPMHRLIRIPVCGGLLAEIEGCAPDTPTNGPVLEGQTVIWTAQDGRDIEILAALVALAEYLETLKDL